MVIVVVRIGEQRISVDVAVAPGEGGAGFDVGAALAAFDVAVTDGKGRIV